MIITDEQKEILIKYLPNAKEIMNSDDVNDILLPLDDLITEIGFDEKYDLNETGLKLQEVYDQIYNQN